MSKPRLQAGIVGSGFAAAFHLEALLRVYSADVEVTGVYSLTAERRDAFANRFEIPVRASLEELLETADVIHVCSPPASHEEIVIAALAEHRHVIVEKPLTGYFGDGSDAFDGRTFSRRIGLEAAVGSVERIRAAAQAAPGQVCYAENWIYAPSIQKEREILEQTGGQILWIHGEEAHSGSHAAYYGTWSLSGGGSLIGKGCHPLSAALYLKRVEGHIRDDTPIRPVTVSARVHSLTDLSTFRDEGHLRTDYVDVEDFATCHITFDDGTCADIHTSELVLGGVHNWLEVAANNHRTLCNINPNNAMQTYNPVESAFDDIYVVEKIGSKQGWLPISPDEDWFTGYQQEIEAFYRDMVTGEEPESNLELAADTISTIYAAYLSAEGDGVEVPIPQIDE